MEEIEPEAWAFKEWVRSGHALSFESRETTGERATRPEKLFSGPFVQEGIALEVLRKCQVNLICVAPGLTEIRVGLEKCPTPKDETYLPNRTISSHTITYRQIKKPQIAFPTASVPFGIKIKHKGYYPCGSSISTADRRATGTLGCLVRRDGILYGLTNNHVTGQFSLTKPRMPILAPGLLDAVPDNLDPFTIGHHEGCAPWVTGIPQNVPIKGNLD